MASMMALREGIATRLATIDELNVYAFIPDTIVTPAAIVAPGEEAFIQWDTSMSRGSDDYTFRVTLLLPRGSDQDGQAKLDAYLAGSGAESVKTAIEGDETLGGVADWAHVTEARSYGRVRWNEIEYYGCELVVTVGV